MESIIKINTDSAGRQVVSAKELFIFLGYDRSQWARWYMTNIINNPYCEENTDWVGFDTMSNGNQTKDFAITVDFAKRLSMMAKTEKGEQARQYFLECERQARNPVANISRLDMARMLLQAEEENEAMKAKIAADAPKVLFAEAVSASNTCVLIKELAAYLTQNGFAIGEKKLFEQLRFHGYLCFKGSYYNLPSQRSLDLKLFEVRKTAIHKPNGTILTSNTTLVTGKGMEYFLNFFLKQSQRA